MAKKKAAANASASPAKAPGKGQKTARTGNRDPGGRLLPGHQLPGPGRPALPQWLKARGSEALEYIFDVAVGTVFVEDDAVRIRAAERIVEYVFGKAGKARVDTELPKTHEEKVAAMEAVLLHAGEAGDVVAAFKVLEALEPTKYGKKRDDGGADDAVDTLDFVPGVFVAPDQAPGGSS